MNMPRIEHVRESEFDLRKLHCPTPRQPSYIQMVQLDATGPRPDPNQHPDQTDSEHSFDSESSWTSRLPHLPEPITWHNMTYSTSLWGGIANVM